MATIGTLTLHEYNDETVVGTLYADVAKTTALDLTGMTVEFIYKTSASQSDDAAITIAATVTDAVDGEIEVQIPNETVSLDKKFFRIDVLSAGDRRTAVYGNITVVDL